MIANTCFVYLVVLRHLGHDHGVRRVAHLIRVRVNRPIFIAVDDASPVLLRVPTIAAAAAAAERKTFRANSSYPIDHG